MKEFMRLIAGIVTCCGCILLCIVAMFAVIHHDQQLATTVGVYILIGMTLLRDWIDKP